MTSRSSFPQSVDQFTELSNVLASDAANVTRYQQLLTQATLTSAEQTELNNLKTTLANKLLDAEFFNKLQDCIVAVENYFLNTVMSDIAKTDVGALRTDVGFPSDLVTNDKSSITNAVNEIKNQLNHDEVANQLQQEMNDVNYAQSNRKIFNGTGLTGGGDLTADRTLSFDINWGDKRYSTYSNTNSNGSYIQFPDGTMIAYVTKAIDSFDVTANNNYFNYDNQSFPATFTSTPTCTISAYSSYSGFAVGSTAQTFIVATSGNTYRYGVQFSGNQKSGGTWYAQIVAYGRWK